MGKKKTVESTPVKKKPKLNAYFKKMLKAKEKNSKKFQYKGNTYVQATLKSGMITYKRK